MNVKEILKREPLSNAAFQLQLLPLDQLPGLSLSSSLLLFNVKSIFVVNLTAILLLYTSLFVLALEYSMGSHLLVVFVPLFFLLPLSFLAASSVRHE